MNKKLIIRGSLIAAVVGVVGASIPFAFIKNNETTESPAYRHDATPVTFNGNLKEITKDTIFTHETDFLNDQPWVELPANANDPIYANVFDQIDEQLIINDIKHWLMDIGTVNEAFQINVNTIDVTAAKNDANKFKIDVDFNIYNSSKTRKLFETKSLPFSYGIGGYKITNNHVSIDNYILPKFKAFVDYAMVGYEFDQIKWVIDAKSYDITNFSFNEYSPTLNTKIAGVSSGVGYLDIKNEGNAYLSNLNAKIITDQIINEQTQLIKNIAVNLAPAQKILQSYATNPGLRDFLNVNATHFADIILNVVPKTNGVDLTTIKNVLVDVLQNKKITSILVNNKNALINILTMLNFNIGGIDIFIENATEEDYENLLKNLIGPDSILKPIITDDLVRAINNLLEKGMIDFILESGIDLISFVNTLIPGISDITSILSDLLYVIQKGDANQPIINLTVDLIKANDSHGQNILTKLIKAILPPSMYASFGMLLDQVLVNNNNLTVSNLQTALSALANPVNAKSGSTIKNYSEFFESMTVTQQIVKQNYDSITHMPDIEIRFGFKFNDTLWINLDSIYKILPENITIDGTSIPVGLIAGVAPNWIGLFSGDYVSDDRILTEQLHYDVTKNSNGQDVLSWQTSQKSVFDVNLPQTVKSLWDTAFIGTGDLIKHFAENFMYHKYYKNDVYRPSIIYKNEIIKGYNPNKKNNQSISFNQLSDAQWSELNQLVNNSMQTVQTGDKYSWKYIFKTYTINKSITNNIVDLNHVISQFIKENNISNGDIPLYIDFNSDYIIRETKFVGIFTIPEVVENNIIFWTPTNVYSNGMMQNKWTFKL